MGVLRTYIIPQENMLEVQNLEVYLTTMDIIYTWYKNDGPKKRYAYANAILMYNLQRDKGPFPLNVPISEVPLLS
jgi:hypothetical protein